MHLNLKALHALRALVGEGTVSAAARRLHRTQPAVSRLLAQLEAEVGFALFRREGRRLTVTAEGLAFYRETERAFAALDDIEAAADDIRMRRAAPLRILAQSHIVHGLLPAVLADFSRRRPAFRFSVEVRSREYISHWIADRQFDVGFAPEPVDHPKVRTAPLFTAPVCVFMPARHALARKARIRIDDLAREPIIATHIGAPMRTRLDALFAERGVTPDIRGESATALANCLAVAHGAGVTVADLFLAQLFERDPALRFRLLSPRIDGRYLVLFPAGAEPSPVAAEFAQAVREAAAAAASRMARLAEPRARR
jgi:DNA-binding transcriptional LysR family regulator